MNERGAQSYGMASISSPFQPMEALFEHKRIRKEHAIQRTKLSPHVQAAGRVHGSAEFYRWR